MALGQSGELAYVSPKLSSLRRLEREFQEVVHEVLVASLSRLTAGFSWGQALWIPKSNHTRRTCFFCPVYIGR
jgi:hypothetical protein